MGMLGNKHLDAKNLHGADGCSGIRGHHQRTSNSWAVIGKGGQGRVQAGLPWKGVSPVSISIAVIPSDHTSMLKV